MISPSLLLLRPSSLYLSSSPRQLSAPRLGHGLLTRRRKGARLLQTQKHTRQPATCFFKPREKSNAASTDKGSSGNWPILERWDVPWQWQTVVLTMVACGVSFALTGLVEASALPYLGFQGGDMSLDEKAEILFGGQFTVTAIVLGVVYGITNTFQPLPDDLFRYEWKEPFNLQNGWLLWAGIGLGGAIITIALAGTALTFFNGEPPQRETDALVRLLPLIGSSGISTACLVGVTGVLAPVLEETVFRGFLMTSLTKWDRSRVFIRTDSKSDDSHHYTCYLEFRRNFTANVSSATRI
ncbi:uncharacterized protein LOC109851493 isoform X2 [Asparagus officinalis]|uniref:uncharacterized protein LOC109851493 isoform X2 n=1 Tax=Asparagus officinalis TaxID=4686 RepID=UPI00098DE25C|nr:uncharacterized protein LOC109851493 isoform X2 [Asparagus officinalis]